MKARAILLATRSRSIPIERLLPPEIPHRTQDHATAPPPEYSRATSLLPPAHHFLEIPVLRLWSHANSLLRIPSPSRPVQTDPMQPAPLRKCSHRGTNAGDE